MRIIILIAAFVVVSLAGVVYFVLSSASRGSSDDPAGRNPKKEFVCPVAEGVVYRDGKTASPRISFSVCRIEKLKRGHLTFPAFDVLAIDDLTINALPDLIVPAGAGPNLIVSAGGTTTSAEKPRLSPEIQKWASVFIPADRKFSGIRIDNFRLNRDGGTNGIAPFVHARSAVGTRRGGGGLKLEGCRVFHEDGHAESVKQARLFYASGVCLEYESGGRAVRSFLYPPPK